MWMIKRRIGSYALWFSWDGLVSVAGGNEKRKVMIEKVNENFRLQLPCFRLPKPAQTIYRNSGWCENKVKRKRYSETRLRDADRESNNDCLSSRYINQRRLSSQTKSRRENASSTFTLDVTIREWTKLISVPQCHVDKSPRPLPISVK